MLVFTLILDSRKYCVHQIFPLWFFCLSSGLDYTNLLAGYTPNMFLPNGMSNNVFIFIKIKNLVVFSNMHDKFASTNLTYNVTKLQQSGRMMLHGNVEYFPVKFVMYIFHNIKSLTHYTFFLMPCALCPIPHTLSHMPNAL